MEESFILNVKQEMPPWIAKIYAAQVADGSMEVYERFIDELWSRILDPINLIDGGCGPGHVCELLATRLPQTESNTATNCEEHKLLTIPQSTGEAANDTNPACCS